jgi:hypothetical protein
MSDLAVTAPAFLEMAHRIVWASAASVGPDGRPRQRILHPFWQWDGTSLSGWIATGPSPTKRAHFDHGPYLSLNYWTTNQDTCAADCVVSWAFDDETRTMVWDLFKNGPAPVGYDPAVVPPWAGGPTSPAFAALRLEPYRLRVMPGAMMLGGAGALLRWSAG